MVRVFRDRKCDNPSIPEPHVQTGKTHSNAALCNFRVNLAAYGVDVDGVDVCLGLGWDCLAL